jgi:hypothetical protein
MAHKATTIVLLTGLSALTACGTLDQIRSSLSSDQQHRYRQQAGIKTTTKLAPPADSAVESKPAAPTARPLTTRKAKDPVRTTSVRPAAGSASTASRVATPPKQSRVVAQKPTPVQANRVQILGALMRTWNRIVPEEIDSEALFGIPPTDLVAPNSRADAGTAAPSRG